MNPHFLLNDENQIKAVESLKRLDKDGYLYYMESDWNYYNLSEPFKSMLGAGCSTFVYPNLEGEQVFYRNFDYKHYLHNDNQNPITGLNVICRVSNPMAKYKSIGVADAFWLDFKNGTYANGVIDDGKTDISPFAMLPYLTMDGMNEMGLAISIMALIVKADWKEIDYNTYEEKLDEKKANYKLEKESELPDPWARKCQIGSIAYNTVDKKAWICEKPLVHTSFPDKPTVLHPVLMRMILDNCKDVNEATNLASMYNVTGAAPDMDFHIMVADKDGNSKVFEWVDNKFNVIDTNHSTNYRFSSDDVFHGTCPRDEALKAGIAVGKRAGLREDYGELTMRLASQDPTTCKDMSKTQYSVIYNLSKKTLKLYSFGDYEKSYEYQL